MKASVFVIGLLFSASSQACLIPGDSDENNFSRCVEWVDDDNLLVTCIKSYEEYDSFSSKCEEQIAETHLFLGNQYYSGKVTPMNTLKAKAHWELAQSRSEAAKENLAYLLWHGSKDVEKDIDEAGRLFTALVEKNNKAAFEFVKKAAHDGNARAMAHYGNFFCRGILVGKDIQECKVWFSRSADLGDIYGQRGMGWLYWKGVGVGQNYKTAFYWQNKAAEQGSIGALHQVAGMYLNGQGVEKSFSEAYKYALIAQYFRSLDDKIYAGYPSAEKIEKELNKAQIDAGQAWASAWIENFNASR